MGSIRVARRPLQIGPVLGALHHRPYPQLQLVDVIGLGQVIVRPQLQATHAGLQLLKMPSP